MRRRALVRRLESEGLTVRVTSRQHLQVFGGGQLLTTLGGSPSDVRADRNALAAIRRSGWTNVRM